MSAQQQKRASNGKVAFVTGGSRGIGKGIAIRLAHDGFDVAINDVQSNKSIVDETVKEIEAIGRKSIGVLADVSKYAEIESNMGDIVKQLGRLDVVVANAGIAEVAPLLETTEEGRRRMVSVNIEGVMTAKEMIKSETKGRIINAASIVAFNPFPMLSHYSASKWAVRGFTQSAAKEWAKYGIRVNAYAPGIVDTPKAGMGGLTILTCAVWDLIDDKLGNHLGLKKGEARKKYVDDLTLLGRLSVPEDLGKLVSFMASEDAEFITGQTLVCDGGIVTT